MGKFKIATKRNENDSFVEREMESSAESRMWLESDILICSGGGGNIFLIFFCSIGKPRCRMLNQGWGWGVAELVQLEGKGEREFLTKEEVTNEGHEAGGRES